MAIPAEQLLASLPPEERAAIDERAQELRCEYQTLQDLRLAHQLTQERLGELLGCSQDGVSRLEQRSDLFFATLRSYVASIGGRLRLIAEFPNRPPVDLLSLSGDEQEELSKPERGRTGRGKQEPVDR
jgi:transcriptional regulator with XRE-family HTH domain